MMLSMIIVTVTFSSNFSAFGFKFKTGFTSQFTTYHLPLAEENDCWEWFLQPVYLKNAHGITSNMYIQHHCRSQNKFASHSLLLAWFDISNCKKGKKNYLLNIGISQIANQNYTIIWLAVWFSPILNILSLFLKFRVKNHLNNSGTQINEK